MKYSNLISTLNSFTKRVKEILNIRTNVTLLQIANRTLENPTLTDTSDATATPEDIVSGKQAFNSSGLVVGSNSGQNTVYFYKCYSVDYSNKTWRGYRVYCKSSYDYDEFNWEDINSNQYYFYDTNLTTLNYSVNIPQVGKIYYSNAYFEAITLY